MLYTSSSFLRVYILYIWNVQTLYVYIYALSRYIRTRTSAFTAYVRVHKFRVTDVQLHIHILLYICSAIISAVDSLNVNAHLYIYSLFSFLYASDTFLPITTYRYHRQSSLSMHKQRDGPKVVKSRQGEPIPGPREDFATVWHRPGARCDNTTSFSSRNLTVLSSLS